MPENEGYRLFRGYHISLPQESQPCCLYCGRLVWICACLVFYLTFRGMCSCELLLCVRMMYYPRLQCIVWAHQRCTSARSEALKLLVLLSCEVHAPAILPSIQLLSLRSRLLKGHRSWYLAVICEELSLSGSCTMWQRKSVGPGTVLLWMLGSSDVDLDDHP